MSDRIVKRMPSGSRSAANPRTQRLRAVAGDREVGAHLEPPGLLDLELHVQPERRRQHVEPRPEVGRGRRDPHAHAATHGQPMTARFDRLQVGLARHHRAGVRERRLRVLQAVAGEHADHPLGAHRAVRPARPPRSWPTPARRTRPRGRRGSGRRRGSARRTRPAPRRARPSSRPSPPPSAPGCRSGSRSPPSPGSRPARRARAAPRPRPGSRASSAARRPPGSPSSRP